MSGFAPSAQDASLLDVATLVSAHEAEAHEAADHEALPHDAAFQDASAFAAVDQLAASKTRPEPPAGSDTTYLPSARLGFGGDVTAAALSALISPTPSEFGAALGGATAATISAPLT